MKINAKQYVSKNNERNFNLFCIIYNEGASCVFPNQPTNKFFLKVEFKKQGIWINKNFKLLFTYGN